MRAYVMIETEVGKAESVARQLRAQRPQNAQVQMADIVAGPFDVIAVLLARDLDSIGKAVAGSVQVLDGISKTTTCLVIDGQARPELWPTPAVAMKE